MPYDQVPELVRRWAEAFVWSDVLVRAYGPTVVVMGVVTQRASYQGQDASGRFRGTQIAVKQGDTWKCAGLQFSGPIPDVPAAHHMPTAS